MREYALVFLVAAATTFLLTPLSRRLAERTGAMARVRERDVHAIPTPRLGGLAMFGGVLAGLLVASRLPTLAQVFHLYSEPKAIVVAGAVICLLGAVDDRWPLDALTKLAGQILAAGAMVLLGIQLSYLYLPGAGAISLSQEFAVPLTVLLTVVLVNAVNMIDGLDGLAAGVAAIAAVAGFTYSYQLSATLGVVRATPSALISAVAAGVCVGFLPHNFNPARLFMGDSGSMLIGLLLAASTTSVTGQTDFGGLQSTVALPFLVPLLVPLAVLAVPFFDLLLAVVRRTRAGRSPFAPDKMHLHHRLVEIGHSHTRAVLLMYFWTALLAFGGVALSFSHGPLLVVGVVGGLALLALVVSGVPRLRALRRPAG